MPSGVYKRLKPSWNKGKKLSEEHKKILISNLNSWKNKWKYRNEWKIGIARTEKTKERISKAQVGKKKYGDFSSWKIGRVGEKANRYVDGRTTYVKILKRTGRKWICEICSELKVEVHHKDRNRKNNNPNNLQILCKMCHEKQHHH